MEIDKYEPGVPSWVDMGSPDPQGAADFYGTRPEMVFDLLTLDCGLSVFLMEAWLGGGAPLTQREFKHQFYLAKNYYFMAYRA